jgi:hypothetical protein
MCNIRNYLPVYVLAISSFYQQQQQGGCHLFFTTYFL